MTKLPQRLSYLALFALALCAAGTGNAAAPAAQAAVAAPQAAVTTPPVPAAPVFARIGDTVITQNEYNIAFSAAARSKFYHGKPPEAEVAKLQREVADNMVSRVLLLREAKKRALRADDAELKKAEESYDRRYSGSVEWKNNRAKLLPPLLERVGEDNMLAQIQKSVRDTAVPDEAQVRAFYAAHPEKFTEPEQLRVAMILLKVDPSAPSATWDKAEKDGKALVKRVRRGEDFAALARKHSNDATGKNGGDMGYLHTGMLADAAQAEVAKLKVGNTTDALRLLQGVGVFRLVDRKPPRLLAFDVVKDRASDLAKREQGDQAWKSFLADMAAKNPAQVDRSRFLPLDAQADARTAPK